MSPTVPPVRLGGRALAPALWAYPLLALIACLLVEPLRTADRISDLTLALVVLSPLCAAGVAQALTQLAPGTRLRLLPVTVALNLAGVVVLCDIAPRFATLQSTWALIALGVFAAAVWLARQEALLPILSLPLYILALLLLLLTFTSGTNPSGGVQRQWLDLGLFFYEPSEGLRLAVMLLCASLLTRTRGLKWRPAVYLTIGVSLAVLAAQGDLGAALMTAIVGGSMLYASGRETKVLALSVLAGLAAVAIVYTTMPYAQARLDTWLDPFDDPLGSSYQVTQGLRAVVAGNIAGRGLAPTDPVHVPAAHTDSILPVLGERSGLVGMLATLGGYGVLLAGLGVQRRMGGLPGWLAMGVSVMVVAQAVVIAGGSTAMVPLMGVTLPFVSYGGSSLLVLYAALGLASGARTPTDAPTLPRQARQVQVALGLALVAVAAWVALWSLFGATLLERALR